MSIKVSGFGTDNVFLTVQTEGLNDDNEISFRPEAVDLIDDDDGLRSCKIHFRGGAKFTVLCGRVELLKQMETATKRVVL